MKTIFKSLMMFAAAALTLAGCEKETVSENAAPEVSGEKITVKAAVKNAATRVSVSSSGSEYSAVWDDDDAIDIVEFAGKSGSITENTAYQLVAAENIEVADELAMFEFELDKTEGEGFTYYAVYPGGNDDSFVAKKYQELVLPMPAVQKPTAASLIDPKANVVIAKAETDAQAPDLYFDEVINAASYARMTIKGLPDDVTPKTVKFENLTKGTDGKNVINIAGCYWYMVNDGSFTAAFGNSAPSATTTITVDQSEADDANVVWFGLAPVGKITDFVVTVTGSDDKEYVKTVTGAETLNFAAGKILNFSVTVENNSPVTIADIKGTGSYIIEDVLVVAAYDSYKGGYIITDSSNEYMFVYTDGAPDIKVGTKFSQISGTVRSYNNGFQMTGVEYTENGTTEVSLPAPTEFDYAKVTEYVTTTATTDQKPTYITYTGKLSVSGTYYNVVLDGGDTYQCSLYYDKSVFSNLSTYNGKTITVKGFITAVSSGKYINTCVTSVEPAESEEPEQPSIFESDKQFVCTSGSNQNPSGLTGSKFNGQNATGFKIGSANNSGTFTSTAVGVAGDYTLSFYAVAWSGKSSTLSITVNNGGTIDGINSCSLTGNTGASGSTTAYTITVSEKDYFSLNIKGLTTASTISFTASGSDKRAIVAGVHLTESDNSGNTGGGTEPEQPTPGDAKTATFNFEALYGTSNINDITSQPQTVDDIKISFSKGSGSTTTAYNKDKEVRAYYGNSITVAAKDDATQVNITSIVFALKSGDNGNTITSSPEGFDTNSWTSSTGASSVVFNIGTSNEGKASGHRKIESITVTYTKQ